MGNHVQRLIVAILFLAAWTPAPADDVDEILRAWSEDRDRNPQRGVHATGRLYTYDHVFQTETRAAFEFWSRPTGESRFDVAPMEPARREPPRKTGRDGKQYSIETRQPERWIFTPDRMRQVLPDAENPEDRPTIHDVDLSPPKNERSGYLLEMFSEFIAAPLRAIGKRIEYAGVNPSDMPMLLEGPRRRNWNIQFGAQHGSQGRIHLVLTPTAKAVFPQVSQLDILLRRADFTPLAFRTFDPAGTLETVHAYSTWSSLEDDTNAFTEAAITSWPPARKPNRPQEVDDDYPPPPPLAVMQ